MTSALLFTVALAVAAPEPLTPEQTLDRRAIGELEFSRDGSRLVFTVTDPPKGNARAKALWLLDVASGRLRQLTFSGKSDGSPHWSPDGSALAFISDREGAAQLYRLPLGGGEAERLTDRKESVTAFRWSPDGSRIALLMNESKPDALAQREKDRDDARVVDKEERHERVWLLDVATKRLLQATAGTWHIDQIEWLPDGQSLVASATDKPHVDAWIDRIYRIDLEHPTDATFHEIAAPRGPFGSLAVSPDGRLLAYVGARVDGPEGHDLFVLPIAGGPARNLTHATIDRPIGQPRWLDRQALSVHVQRGFKSALAIIDQSGKPVFDELDVNPSSYARSNAGALAFVGETATRAPELYVRIAAAKALVEY